VWVIGEDVLGEVLAAQLGTYGVSAKTAAFPPPDADAVISLHGLRNDLRTVHGDAFACAHAVAAHFTAEGGLFITVQDTGGDFGLGGAGARAWAGGLPGLAKTLALEIPGAQAKAIDLERGERDLEAQAHAIIGELLTGGPELEVGLHADGRRTTLLAIPTPARVDAAWPVGKGDVIVASGGARGVTAATLIALCREVQPRLVLLGRSEQVEETSATHGLEGQALTRALITANPGVGPAALRKLTRAIQSSREIRANLHAMANAGSEARYVSVDVTDAEAVARALQQVRADWGPIAGLVHGAGVLADKLVVDKTPDQFAWVFDTKVKGLQALLAATENDPLKSIVLFSSVAARCGNRGQVDYAMANELLNKVAAQLRQDRPQAVVKSLGWGPWEGGMVTPALEAHFAAMGVPLIGLNAGAQMLLDELRDPRATEIVLGGGPDLAGASKDIIDLAVHTARASHPYLADHTIAGVPVVPVALAMEWFARAARRARPDLQLSGFTDLQVVRGIRLKGYENGGDWHHVHAHAVEQGEDGCLSLELRDRVGNLCYSATALMSEQVLPAGKPAVRPNTLQPLHDVYDGDVLFHGADFQVIRDLEISNDGVAATLEGTAAKGWVEEPWQTDPAAVDGGLQLAVLWSKHMLGGAALPMGVKSFHSYTDKPPNGPYRAVLRGQVVGRDKLSADITLAENDGTLVAEIRGVDMILRPDGARR
jgi:NAD(P)-dependent dehydrogenase (short-subunit alcohol dehydrogenase family)